MQLPVEPIGSERLGSGLALLNRVCFDPDACIVSAFSWAVAADAALRSLGLLGGFQVTLETVQV